MWELPRKFYNKINNGGLHRLLVESIWVCACVKLDVVGGFSLMIQKLLQCKFDALLVYLHNITSLAQDHNDMLV